MLDAISHLHDATLLEIRFDWANQTCELQFRSAPAIPLPFALAFAAVTELVVSTPEDWGPSVSVLEAKVLPNGRHSFSMQSGATLTVVANSYSFKPMPVHGTT